MMSAFACGATVRIKAKPTESTVLVIVRILSPLIFKHHRTTDVRDTTLPFRGTFVKLGLLRRPTGWPGASRPRMGRERCPNSRQLRWRLRLVEGDPQRAATRPA